MYILFKDKNGNIRISSTREKIACRTAGIVHFLKTEIPRKFVDVWGTTIIGDTWRKQAAEVAGCSPDWPQKDLPSMIEGWNFCPSFQRASAKVFPTLAPLSSVVFHADRSAGCLNAETINRLLVIGVVATFIFSRQRDTWPCLWNLFEKCKLRSFHFACC